MLYQMESGASSMQFLFFGSKKKRLNKEAQIEAVKKDTIAKIEKASEGIKQVNEILDRDDITLQIFYATRRKRGNKHG